MKLCLLHSIVSFVNLFPQMILYSVVSLCFISCIEAGSNDRKDTGSKNPLAGLAKSFKGSKRNALLKWCQQKTITYSVSE